jgi:hypothetical protein
MTRKTRIVCAALAASSLLAVVPAASQADYTFGSRLDHEPSNSAPGHNCREDGSDDATPPCTRLAIDESFAVSGGLVAPMDGKIVRFRIRAGAPGSLTLRVARYADGMARGDGAGPTVNYQGRGFDENEANAIETFPADLAVHKGDSLGFDSSSTSALYCSSGGPNQGDLLAAPGRRPSADHEGGRLRADDPGGHGAGGVDEGAQAPQAPPSPQAPSPQAAPPPQAAPVADRSAEPGITGGRLWSRPSVVVSGASRSPAGMLLG